MSNEIPDMTVDQAEEYLKADMDMLLDETWVPEKHSVQAHVDLIEWLAERAREQEQNRTDPVK